MIKTKKIVYLLALLPLWAGMAACTSDDITEAKPAKETLIVQGGNIEFNANQEGAEVPVTADCHWVMTYDKGTWTDLTVQPHQGNGNGTLVIRSGQNTTTQPRTATLLLTSDGGLHQQITITQTLGGAVLTVSTLELSFEAEATASAALQQTFSVTSNTAWTLRGVPAWLHPDVTQGSSGVSVVTLNCDDIQDDVARTAVLTVSDDGGNSREVTVTQQPKSFITLSVDPEGTVFLPFHPADAILNITSNGEWRVYMPDEYRQWLELSTTSGVGNGELMIRCEENNSAEKRTAAIILVAGTKTPTLNVVIVEQEGNSSSQPVATSVELQSLSVTRQSAGFLLNIVASEVVGNYGIVYSTTNNQPTLGNGTEVNIGSGGMSQGLYHELTSLQDNTTYYARAFVQKTSGEVVYSNVVTVTTLANELTVGSLWSMAVYNTYAEFRFGFVADEAVSDYGLVYSETATEPTATNGTVVTIGTGGTSRNVMGVLNNLQEKTKYYVRAFVQTAKGYTYSTNTVTITTSAAPHKPGESDNPDPTLAPRRR